MILKRALLLSFLVISIASQAWPKFKIPRYSWPSWKHSFMISVGNIGEQRNLIYPTFNINGFEKGQVDYGQFARYNVFFNNYTITNNFRAQFPELDDTYGSWFLLNWSNVSKGANAEVYKIDFGFSLSNWLALHVGLGHVKFNGDFRTHFSGHKNYDASNYESDILNINYVQNTSSYINNYQLRFKSPFFWDVLGFYYELGVSLQYNYQSTLKEESWFSHSEYTYPSFSSQEFKTHRQFQSTGTSLDIIRLPFSVGLNIWLSPHIMAETSVSIRKAFGNSNYGPEHATLFGFGFRFDTEILKRQR